MNILTDQLFCKLMQSASLAPSADNMQPWEFGRNGDTIEVFSAPERMLPTDVSGMFTWVSIGAAIQNIAVTLAALGFRAEIKYMLPLKAHHPVAIIRLSEGIVDEALEKWIQLRATNRTNYKPVPLDDSLITRLTQSINGPDAGIHWMKEREGLRIMSSIDAHSSFIRLEHKPFHDELFDVLRFSRKQMEQTMYGLDFKSLGVPAVGSFLASLIQRWSVNRLIIRTGMGRLVAKMLSMKLLKAGAMCLITAKRRDPAGYMEAGRAMEQLWLAATSEKVAVHPYGAIPQYLTKSEIEPETFLPEHLEIVRRHKEPFFSLFPGAKKEYPAIVLRIGIAKKQSKRSDMRLTAAKIINSSVSSIIS